MATVKTAWKGGTAGVAQVATNTITGTWANGNTILTQILDENGLNAQVVTSTATGSNPETNVIDVHVVDLNNSVLSFFTPITWAKGSSTTITATADVAGVPLSGGVEANNRNRPTCSVGVGSGNVSTTLADTTTNAGPNDFNSTANWVGTTLPTDTDVVYVGVDDNGVPHSILYGLNQATIDLNQFITNDQFTGGVTIGNPAASLYLLIDVSEDHGTNSGSTDKATAILQGSCRAVWLKGNIDAVSIQAAGLGNDAVKIHSTNTACVITASGFNVRGKVTIADNSSLDVLSNSSASADIRIGSGVGGASTGSFISRISSTAGNVVTESTANDYFCTGGTCSIEGTASVAGDPRATQASGSGGGISSRCPMLSASASRRPFSSTIRSGVVS